MSQQTPEELRTEAASLAAQAAVADAEVQQQKELLKKQQAELRKLQAAVVEYGRLSVGATPQAQQSYASAVINLQSQINGLKASISNTNAKINQLTTQVVNQTQQARSLSEQATAIENNTNTAITTETPTDLESSIAEIPTIPADSDIEPDLSSAFNPIINTTLPATGVTTEPDLSSVFQTPPNTSNGLTTKKNNTRSEATKQNNQNYQQSKDWRVRLSLADNANYLYNAPNASGIITPLRDTKGVVFPYLPSISVSYAARYDSPDIIHSNYKIFQYKGSEVDNVSIQGYFTAQDTKEAEYLLAVIHFFRSITKMFYGQDQNPKSGTPPPLCYLTGLGEFQFNNHPLVVTQFQYNLPDDVDYIRAGRPTTVAGESLSGYITTNNSLNSSTNRLLTNRLQPGARPPLPNFNAISNTSFVDDATYVPTKMTINISCLPVVSRYDISNQFSLEKYGTGELLRGSTRSPRRGIW